jgi:hypothetical protein
LRRHLHAGIQLQNVIRELGVTVLVEREIHEGDHERAAEEQEKKTQERKAEDVVAVRKLGVRLDGRDRDIGRARFRDGVCHRSTGSTAITAKSSARYARE